MGLSDYVSNMALKVNYDGSLAEQGLQKLMGLAGGLITVYAMKQLADYSIGLAKLGAQANLTEASFEKMVGNLGGNSEKMISDMKKATLSMVDDTDLMGMAWKGLNAKINFKDQLVAMEYATKYALSTGQNFQDVYDQIMTSFMRNTDRGLKTLGVNVAGSKNVVRDAVIIMQGKMKEFSVDMDDPILKQKQLAAQISETKERIGKDLIPAYSALLTATSVLTGATDTLLTSWGKFWEGLGTALNTNVPKQIVSLKELSNATLKALNEEAQQRLQSGNYTLKQAQAIEAVIASREKELELRKKIEQKTPGALDATTGLPTKGIVAGTDKTSSFKPQLTTEEINAATEEQKRLNKIRSDGEEQSQKDFIEINKTTLEASAQTTDKKIDLLYKEYLANYNFLVLMGANKDQLKNLEMKYILDKEEIVNTANSKEKQQWDEQQQWKIKQYTEAQQTVEAAQKENMNQSLDGRLKLLKDQYDMEKGFLESQGVDTSELTKKYERDKTKTYQDETTKRIGYIEDFISVASNLTNGLQTLNDAMTARQIKNLDNQHLSEKEYAKRKAQIDEDALEKTREFARAEQLIIIAQTISNVAKGVSSSLTGPPFIKWLDVAATIAAGAIQIATIEAQNFANGRGLVDMLSNGRNADTVNARLGKGEYVMPADKTAANIDELEAMRKGVGTQASGQQITQNFYSVPLESMIQVQRDIQRKNLATQRI
jgi:hypothetical protein